MKKLTGLIGFLATVAAIVTVVVFLTEIPDDDSGVKPLSDDQKKAYDYLTEKGYTEIKFSDEESFGLGADVLSFNAKDADGKDATGVIINFFTEMKIMREV